MQTHVKGKLAPSLATDFMQKLYETAQAKINGKGVSYLVEADWKHLTFLGLSKNYLRQVQTISGTKAVNGWSEDSGLNCTISNSVK